jgi:hypothetical protein
MKFYLSPFLLSLTLLSVGCGPEPGGGNSTTSSNSQVTSNVNAAKKANDNLEELGMLIKLTDEPEDVVWRDEPSAGGRKLTAVILYLPASTDKIIAEAEKHGAVSDTSIEPPDWFPKELISQSELSGGLLQGKQYQANDFLQSPYSSGRLVRIEGHRLHCRRTNDEVIGQMILRLLITF